MPMNDFLGSVKASEGVGRGPQVYDIEAGYTTTQSERTKEMEEFFAQVDEVKQAIAGIKAKQREIQRMHEQSKTIVRKNDMQQHRAEVQVRTICWHWSPVLSTASWHKVEGMTMHGMPP